MAEFCCKLYTIIWYEFNFVFFSFFHSSCTHFMWKREWQCMCVWRRALIHEPCASVGRWNAACSVNHIVITVLFRCLLDVYYPFASMLNNKFSLRPPESATLRAWVREVQNRKCEKVWKQKSARERKREEKSEIKWISLFIMKCVELVSNMFALCSMHFRTNNLQIGYKFSYSINSMFRFYANEIFCDFGAVAWRDTSPIRSFSCA